MQNQFQDNNDFENRKVDLEAATWVSKRVSGFSAAEQDEFFEWLAEDPSHAEWYRKHFETWKRLDKLAEWKPEHSDTANPDLLRNKSMGSPLTVWLGLAASIAILFFIWISITADGGRRPVNEESFVAETFESHVLPDGSKAEMKDGAAMTVSFTEQERRIEMVSSEVHFDVEKNPKVPFVVVAKGWSFKAVGTAFSVKIENDHVELLVTEGRVQMSRLNEIPAMHADREDSVDIAEVVAGQKSYGAFGYMGETIPIIDVTPEEIEAELEWKPRSLEFNRVPLRKVVAEFNKRNAVKLVLQDPELEDMIVVASFHTANVDKLLQLLEVTMDVKSNHLDDGRILLSVDK